MKKISLFLIFIWCFSFNIAFATCSLTGGACQIEDLIETPKKEKNLNKKIVEKTKIKQNSDSQKQEGGKNFQTKRDKK